MNISLKSSQNSWKTYVKKFKFSKFVCLEAYSQQLY